MKDDALIAALQRVLRWPKKHLRALSRQERLSKVRLELLRNQAQMPSLETRRTRSDTGRYYSVLEGRDGLLPAASATGSGAADGAEGAQCER